MRNALTLLLLVSGIAHAQHESEYTRVWCTEHKGEAEYTLRSGPRVDCLTPRYAVEVERAPKFYQAIGQSLYYAANTGKQPGIALIVGPKDERYLKRLRLTIAMHKLPITVWTISE